MSADDNTLRNSEITRRDVVKGVGAAAIGTVAAGSATGTVAATDAPGETTMLQYFHTEWTEMEANLETVADAGFDAIHVPAPQESVLTEEDQTEDHPQYGPDYPYMPPLGYQPFDRTSLDSEFGTEAEFRSMIDAAHAQGIDVIVDIVLNHNGFGPELDEFPNVNSEHFYQEGGIEGWMYSYDPNDDRCYDENQWECDPWAIEHHDLVGLPTLDWTTDTVQDLAYDYLQLIADCGADGVRWDAAKHMHNWVFEDFLNPWADDLGLYTVGEVLFEPIGYIDEYAQTGMDITDYPLFYTMKNDAFTSGGDFRALDGDDAGYAMQNPFQSLTMIANHDSAPPELEELARAFILTYEGYPRVYNYLIDFDDPDLQNLLWIRGNLLGGSAINRYVDEDLIIFEREDNAVVAINKGWDERTEWVDVPWTDEPLEEYTGNASDTEANDDGWAPITAPAGGWAVYAPEDAAGSGGTETVTLQIEAPTAADESVYFTGSTGSLTDWGTGVEGTNAGDDLWEVTIEDPGTFEWKARRGPAGESGDVWESGDNHSDAELSPDHNGWSDGFDGIEQVTLQVEAPTEFGESVYFTGSTDSLTGWGEGIEGTHMDNNVWTVTIEDPGAFEWKTRRGPSDGSGDIWESGENHSEADRSPEHNGWSDGYSG